MLKIQQYLLEIPPFVGRDDAIKFATAELSRIMMLCGLPYTGVKGCDVMGMVKEDGVPVISLGETPLKKKYGLVADANVGGGYNIKTIDDNVFIYSPEPEGIINGVYHFCREVFGYKFYAMDEERVEIKDEYFVPYFDISEKPDFLGRSLDFYGAYRLPEYGARLRQNAASTHCEDTYHCGTGTPWAVLGDQSLAFQLIPREEYKTEEYIKKGWWSEKGDQLCWTKAYYDEEMFELLCSRLIDAVKAQPTKLFYMLGQTDNREYCRCLKCQEDYKKYGVSGVFIRLVNKLADRVKAYIDEFQGGREHYLCMFAYLQTEVPPVKMQGNKIVPLDESVIARDNVMIRFAPIEAGVNYSLIDPVKNPHSTCGFIGWKTIAKHFTIWDYGTNFQGYIAPYSDWDVLEKSLRFYKSIGAKDLLTQMPAHTTGTAFWAMKMYMRACLMWDTTLSARDLMNDFIDKYYGKAQDEIREYIALLDEHYARLIKNTPYAGYIWEPIYLGVTFDKKTLKKIENIFNRAFAKAKGESVERRPIIEKRLRCETLFYRFTVLCSYIHELDLPTLKKLFAGFKRDALEHNLIAFKNGWRWGNNKMSTFFKSVEQRIERMEKAEQYESAENNPLNGLEYKKQW